MRHLLSAPLLSSLIGLAVSATTSDRRVAVLYLLSEVLRWAPSSSVSATVKQQLLVFRKQLEDMFAAQGKGYTGAAAGSSDGAGAGSAASATPTSFSTELQATAAVFVSLSLHLQHKRTNAATASAGASWSARRAARGGDTDDVLPTAPWFTSLVEVSGIVDALVNRSRSLPDSFLFAEDTFLRRVALNETVTIESSHPVSNMDAVSRTVDFPAATKLTVRFDATCATPSSHSVEVRQPASAGSAGVLASFNGPFGGKTVTVPGGSVSLQYPIVRRECMKFAPSTATPGQFNVADNRLSIECAVLKQWGTIRCDVAVTEGTFTWEIRIDKTTPSGNIFFGVMTAESPTNQYLGKDDLSWGWIGTCLS